MAHMAEHLLIGDIAALLLVLGHDRAADRAAAAQPGDRPAARADPSGGGDRRSGPSTSTSWHSPYLYQAALRHDALHALEHATFLIFGMAVYMALLGPLPKPAWFNNAARLVYIVAVRLTGTVLANILIFGGTVFYPIYRSGDALWHISSMADQVAAGGLMMVEESFLTIGLFCWLFLRVARENEERQALHGLRAGARPRARRAPRRTGGGGRAQRGAVGRALRAARQPPAAAPTSPPSRGS